MTRYKRTVPTKSMTGAFVRFVMMSALAWGMLPQGAVAETPAGARIDNVATIGYGGPADPRSVTSNPTQLIVAERLDIALVAGVSVAGGPLRVTLTNSGNGTEAYDIVATATDAVVRRIYIDVDGDGRIGSGDTPLDARTPPLASGGTLALLVEVDVTGANPVVTFTARAATGSGTPGTVFDGRGDGGGDAVVGPTGAAASVTFTPSATPAPTLLKRQEVRAPDGSTSAVTGAVITYTLEAAFPAAVSGPVRISDDIPSGTRFVPGSVTLDGAALTDAADTDVGVASNARVTVTLASPAAGARHIVQFQTVIQ